MDIGIAVGILVGEATSLHT